MYKIRKIKLKNHPILRDLELDFCNADGKAVDTVIIAGENGTGKSAILNYLYGLTAGNVTTESQVVLESNGSIIRLDYHYDEQYGRIWVRDNSGLNTLPGHDNFKKKYGLSGVFSDVDINFRAENLSSVRGLQI